MPMPEEYLRKTYELESDAARWKRAVRGALMEMNGPGGKRRARKRLIPLLNDLAAAEERAWA